MHVPRAEVETVLAVVLVPGERDFLPGEGAVPELAHVHVEVAGRPGGDVGEPVAVGRKRRIHVQVLVVREHRALAGGHVEHPQPDVPVMVIHGVHDEAPVGGPGRHRVVPGARCQLFRDSGRGIHPPDRARHGDRDALAVRRPLRRPRGAARRRREVEVVHVVPTVARRRVRPTARLGERRRGEQQGRGEKREGRAQRAGRGFSGHAGFLTEASGGARGSGVVRGRVRRSVGTPRSPSPFRREISRHRRARSARRGARVRATRLVPDGRPLPGSCVSGRSRGRGPRPLRTGRGGCTGAGGGGRERLRPARPGGGRRRASSAPGEHRGRRLQRRAGKGPPASSARPISQY